MRRIEVVASLAVLVAWVVVIAFFYALSTWGIPNIVTCLEKDPNMGVEVYGHVIERDWFGCKVYWYAGRDG